MIPCLLLCRLLSSFDCCCISTVAKPKDSRQYEKSLNSEGLPDPTAEKGDQYGDQMVDGYPGRNRCAHLVGIVGKILYINIRCHRRKGYDRIQDIVHTADYEGDLHWEKVMCKSVKETDNDKDQRIGDHNDLIAEAIDDPPDDRRREISGNGGNGKEEADHRGARSIKKDKHIGAEGKKDLLPGSIKNLKHIVFRIFPVKIKTPLRPVRHAVPIYLQSANGPEKDNERRNGKDDLIRNHIAGQKEKDTRS